MRAVDKPVIPCKRGLRRALCALYGVEVGGGLAEGC